MSLRIGDGVMRDVRINGKVFDPITLLGIEGVQVQSGTYSDLTDNKGEYDFTTESVDVEAEVTFSKSGYSFDSGIAKYNSFNFDNIVDAIANPDLPASSWRIILTWALNPYDLDAHLATPDEGIINKDNKNLDGNATLNRDDNWKSGPETLTIDTLLTTGTYNFYVERLDDPGGNDLYRSEAIVRVFNSDGFHSKYKIQSEETVGNFWNVFEIVNGSFITKNVIQSSAP